MNSITLVKRSISVALLFSASIFTTNCGGGSSGGGGSNPIPSASISETNSSMNAGASQVISATVNNPSGVISCGFGASIGSFGAASLSGNTCSATYTAPSSMTQVATATLSFTGGGASTSASLTINPVAQSVSLPSTLNVDLNGTLVLTSSNVTASASCPTTSVTFTVVPVTTDIAHAAGSTLASWSVDPTHANFGSISGGNALPEDKSNTYKVTAICGSSVSNASTLTVNDVAPTLTSVSPNTYKASAPATTLDLFGSGFSAQSSTQNASQWLGTLAQPQLGPCSQATTTSAGTAWISSTHIQQFNSGYSVVGTWHYSVYNMPTASGAGGGIACLDSAFVITANVITGTGRAIVTVDPGTSSTPGTATVVKNGAATQFALGLGAGSPIAQGDVVFVPNRADHSITQIDTAAMSSQTISTGAEYAPVIVAAGPNTVLVAATAANGDASQGAILALRGNSFTKVADAPYFSDLAITGQNILWVATPKGSTTAEVHQLDLSGGSERIVRLSQSADSLKFMSDGTLLAFHVGDANALVLDSSTLSERGSVSFAKGLYGFSSSGDYATLSDGSIGKVAVSADGAGNPVANFTLIDSAEKNYGSFWVDTSSPGTAKVYSVTHDGSGTATPRVHNVPMAQ